MNELDQIRSEIFHPNEQLFLKMFQTEWEKQVSQLYYSQIQLHIGNRIRPRLVYWGYCAGTPIEVPEQMYTPIQIAVVIELIHKASILLDDYIDGDEIRRGKISFWAEYGEKKTSIFVLSMIGRAIQILNTLSESHNFELNDYFNLMKTLANTMENMSLGVLEELDLDESSQFDIQKIQGIIDKETSALLSNSLLFGYYASGRYTNETLSHIELIGRKCGFMFQTMNDLEPLCQAAKNTEYKGHLNTDFASKRKNIGIAYLYPQLGKREKAILLKAQEHMDDQTILKIISEHNIIEQILAQMESVYLNILELICTPTFPSISQAWQEGFSQLISRLYQLCLNRLQNSN